MTDADRSGVLRLGLWVAIVALIAAIPPVWPYGFYVLLRLLVTVVAIYALVVVRGSSPSLAVGLAVTALLFNPVIPVHLPKAVWVPIDLGVAAFLWVVNLRLAPRDG